MSSLAENVEKLINAHPRISTHPQDPKIKKKHSGWGVSHIKMTGGGGGGARPTLKG